MEIGNYVILLITLVLGTLLARFALQPLRGLQGSIEQTDLLIIGCYVLTVGYFVHSEGLLLRDFAMRLGYHVAALGFGWWTCMQRISSFGIWKKFILLAVIIPLVSGWATIGWLFNWVTAPIVLLLGFLTGAGAIPLLVALVCRAKLLPWLRQASLVHDNSKVASGSYAVIGIRLTMILLALVLLWGETRPTVWGDPLSFANDMRNFALDRFDEDQVQEVRRWCQRFETDNKGTSQGLVPVERQNWPRVIMLLKPPPSSVHVNPHTAVLLEWDQFSRNPVHGIVIGCRTLSERDLNVAASVGMIHVRQDVYAWYGKLGE
jgi:hypothetical protein